MTKLTDSEHKKTFRSPKTRPIHAKTNKHWSDRQKLDCVNTFLMVGGSPTLTAKVSGVPYETIMFWKRSDWWNNLVNEIRKEERIMLSTRLKNVMEASWTVVEDRLANGDWIYDQKTGELRRKPVNVRDAGKIALDAANLRTKLDIEENHTIANEQIEEKLNKLATAFTNLSRGIVVDTTPEEIEYVESVKDELENVDAIHEGREEGLPPGEPLVQLETGTTEEPQ